MDTVASLIPFLEDLPFHARDLVKVISILVPHGVQRDEDGKDILRYRNVKGQTFEKARAGLAARSEFTAISWRFDPRVWDDCGGEKYNWGESRHGHCTKIHTLRTPTCLDGGPQIEDHDHVLLRVAPFDHSWAHSPSLTRYQIIFVGSFDG